MYAEGEGVVQNHAKAAEWHRKAATQGNAGSQYALGCMYDDGKFAWCRMAKAPPHWHQLQGLFWPGLKYLLTFLLYWYRMKKVLEWYRKAAAQGYAGAQYSLGGMYANGEGVAQDDAQALEWTRKAAEQGNAEAQFNLGFMYREGLGVPKDYAQAAEWFRKAAKQRIAEAQFNLGIMYADGEGVPQDYAQAHMWFNLAAAQGGKDATERRDKVTKSMTPDQIAEAQKLSREWAEQHQ
jgi:hypothetical protein